MSQTLPSQILARGAEPASKGVSLRPARAAGLDVVSLPPAVGPDKAVEIILTLLSGERFRTARRLAAEALSRFPDNRRVANAWRIFESRGKPIRRPASEPDRSAELAWLGNPPASVRGKWVALLGSRMVASADTLPELAAALRSESLPTAALVHRIE